MPSSYQYESISVITRGSLLQEITHMKSSCQNLSKDRGFKTGNIIAPKGKAVGSSCPGGI